MVGGFSLFGSTVTVVGTQRFDERHYFLIQTSDVRTVMCSVSCVVYLKAFLPLTICLNAGITSTECRCRVDAAYIANPESQAEELSKPNDRKILADRTREVADYIDALDEKVFGGVLLIGGLVAIFNPLAGAAIAANL